MTFEIGDKVIYPNHGLGVVQKIESRTIMGMTCGFYQLRMVSNETTVLVPVVNVDNVGLRRAISDEEIVERTLYTMVNEGAKILEEGIAQRASDIDVVWVYGYGWPVYRGGPMFWADTEGLPKIVEGLKRQEQRMGSDFSFSKLLLDKAEKGEKISR